MNQLEFELKILNESNNPLPVYAKYGDSGMDVRCVHGFTINPGETRIIDTGISVSIPYPGLELQARPRSGTSYKTKLRISNSPGTIDQGFTGTIGIIMDNIGNVPECFSAGERIAQLVLCPVYKIKWNPVESRVELGQSDRGVAGYGSTGTA